MNRKVFKGFTIIEVLVVIVIIGLVMAVGSVRYSDFTKRQQVVTVKRQLMADIRAAQSDAASGIKPGGCNSQSYTLEGYAFRLLSSGGPSTPASYETFALCKSSVATENFITKSASLPLGVTIVITTSPGPLVNPVIFKPLANGTNLAGGATSTITINTGINSDRIQIGSAGEIK